jgi:hypothetical protein
MDGVVHTTACLSPIGIRGVVFVEGALRRSDGVLRRDQRGVLQPIWIVSMTVFWARHCHRVCR